MTDPNKTTPSLDAQPAADQDTHVASSNRRKLVTGLASSSLLMTVASRPVWATGGTCTPSALASANLSGQHDWEGCGISAGWWSQKFDQWPSQIHPDDLFFSIFDQIEFQKKVSRTWTTVKPFQTYGGQDLSTTGGPTLRQVILAGGIPTCDANPGEIGLHLIGALCNAYTFPSSGGAPGYAYTPQDLFDGWKSLNGKPESAFNSWKSQLDLANNLFDSKTSKPTQW